MVDYILSKGPRELALSVGELYESDNISTF